MTNEKAYNISGGTRARLTAYIFITGLSFFFLASRPGTGLGFLIFAVIQAAMIIYLLPRTGRLWFLAPALLLALAPVMNACPLWRPYNPVIMALLYAAAFCGISMRSQGWTFLGDCLRRAVEPLSCVCIPFRWAADAGQRGAGTARRVLKALLIAVPSVLVLLAVLSGADMIFSHAVGGLLREVFGSVNIGTLLRLVLSLFVALYLFGHLWLADSEAEPSPCGKPKKADMLVMGILLGSILAVYTSFCAIQFRYLFCGAELPYGLSYTDYARRGFFELLGLSGVNLGLILFTVRRRGEGSGAVKAMCCYLCVVTAVLLASSFYRMALYCGSDGLTRMRFFVLGFLIFEALGLAVTAVYIFKPAFNPGLAYLGLGLVYYLLLNLVPVDYFVAKSQVDMFLSGERADLEYAVSLSADAAPQIARAYTEAEASELPPEILYINRCVEEYFEHLPDARDWRGFNLSEARAKKIYEELKSDGK